MSTAAYTDLLNRALIAASNNEKHFAVEFDERFDLQIVLRGDGWDERVDARIAKFVLELQHALDRVQDEFFEFTAVKDQRLLVKVRNERGSSKLKAEIGKLLRKMVGDLTTTQKTVLLTLTILSVAGYFTTAEVLDYKKTVQESNADEETKRELIQVIDRQTYNRTEYEKPIRSLVNSMSADDTIELPMMEEPVTKDQAKTLFPRKPRSKSQTDFVDDHYLVHDISFDDPISAQVEVDGRSIKAELLLNAPQLDAFYSEIKRLQVEAEKPVEMDLQITVRYSNSGIKEATIVGLGEPRSESKKLADILKD